MKAWVLEDSTNADKGISLVFADSRSAAKKQASNDNGLIYQTCLDPDSYIDIRATRAPYADGAENLKEQEMMVLLIQNGWWFTIGNKKYDKDNLQELQEVEDA